MKNISIILILYSISIIANCQNSFEKTYGGVFDEYSHSVLQTDDNGFIICGFTSSFGLGLEDIYIVKTDESGNIEWDHTYGGSGDDHGYFITKTNDGGYIICAESTSFGTRKAYLVKINSTGDTLWTNTYKGLYRSTARQILQNDDGSYIVCGTTSNTELGQNDVFLFKTDENGELLWSKIFGGTDTEFAYAMCKTLEGGYILCGGTKSFGAGSYDVYIIKTNEIGDTIWTKTIGGEGYDAGYSIIQRETGNIIIGGVSSSFGPGAFNILVTNLNEGGGIIWTKTIDYIENEQGCHISQTSDNCIAGCGWTSDIPVTNSDILIFKMDNDGNIIWTNTFGGPTHEVGYAIYETSDLGFIVTGYTVSYGAGMSDMYLIKTNSNGIITSINDINVKLDPIEIYPIPCSNILYLKKTGKISQIEMISINGKCLRPIIISQVNQEILQFDISDFPRGVYIVKIKYSDSFYYKKIIIN